MAVTVGLSSQGQRVVPSLCSALVQPLSFYPWVRSHLYLSHLCPCSTEGQQSSSSLKGIEAGWAEEFEGLSLVVVETEGALFWKSDWSLGWAGALIRNPWLE